jgi:hypothetical protein
MHEVGEELAWEGTPVDVCDVGAEDKGGLGAGAFLEVARHARGKLNGVRGGLDDAGDGAAHVLDAGEKGVLVEEAVVDGDVEALAVGGEEAVEARGAQAGDMRRTIHAGAP